MPGSSPKSQAGGDEVDDGVVTPQRQAADFSSTSTDPERLFSTDADVTTATNHSGTSLGASSNGDSSAEVSNLLCSGINLSSTTGDTSIFEDFFADINEPSADSPGDPIPSLQGLSASQDPIAVPSPTQSQAVTLLAQAYERSLADDETSTPSSNPSELGSPSISPRVFYSDLPTPKSSPASPSSTHASSHTSAKLRAISPGAEEFCINRLPPEVLNRIVNLLLPYDSAPNRHDDVPGGRVSRSFKVAPPSYGPRAKMIYELLRWRHWFKRLRFNKGWARAVGSSNAWAHFVFELLGQMALAPFYEPSRENLLQRAERVLGTCCMAGLMSGTRTCGGRWLKLTRTAYLGPVPLCALHRHVPVDVTENSPFYACHVCLLQTEKDRHGELIRDVMPTSDKYFAFVDGNVCDKCRSTKLVDEMYRVPHSWWWAVPERERSEHLLGKVLDRSDAVFNYVMCGEGDISHTMDAISQELWLEFQTPFLRLREEALVTVRNDREKALFERHARQATQHLRFPSFDLGEDFTDFIETEEEEDTPPLSPSAPVYLNHAQLDRVIDKAIRCWCWYLIKNGIWTAPVTCVEFEDRGLPLTFHGLPFETTCAPLGSTGHQRQSGLLILNRQGDVIPSSSLVTPAFDMLTRVDEIWTDLFSSIIGFAISNLAEIITREYGDTSCAAELRSEHVLELLHHRQVWQRPFKTRGRQRIGGTTDIDNDVPMIPASLRDMPGKASKLFKNIWSSAQQELTACDCQICKRAKRKRQEETKEERKKKAFKIEGGAGGILLKA